MLLASASKMLNKEGKGTNKHVRALKMLIDKQKKVKGITMEAGKECSSDFYVFHSRSETKCCAFEVEIK